MSTVYWNVLPGRRRRHADLAGGDLLALLLQRLDHVLRRQPRAFSFSGSSQTRMEYWPAPNTLTLPTPGRRATARPCRLMVRVVREIEAVVALVRRGQRRRTCRIAVDFFFTVTPCACTACGKRGERARHAVLHQHLREVEVGADLEGDVSV